MVFLTLQHTVQFKSVTIDTDTNMLRMCGITSCMCVNGYLRYILDQMHWKLVTTTRFNVLFAILNVKIFWFESTFIISFLNDKISATNNQLKSKAIS